MKLYIANCTKHELDFQYRVPETGKLQQQHIPVGRQIMVHKDAAKHELESIITQHEAYGLVPARDVKRAQAFVGMCYSFDEPVNMELVMVAHEHNDDMLEKQGNEIRKETLVSIDHTLRTDAQERGGSVSEVAIDIDEVTKPGQGDGFSQTLTTDDSRKRGNNRSNNARKGK